MAKKTITAEQREKRCFWKHHIDTWSAGNLNQSQYCSRHQLNRHRFVYWKRKFSSQKQRPPICLVEVSEPNIFRAPNQGSSTPLQVAVGDRFKIEVAPGFDPVTLKQVIVTLGQL